MGDLTLPVLIALVSMILSAVTLFRSTKKDTSTDAASAAAVNAATSVKLDTISSGVEDIRVELRSMREKQDQMNERIVKVEQRASSNTHRLDALEKLIKNA